MEPMLSASGPTPEREVRAKSESSPSVERKPSSSPEGISGGEAPASGPLNAPPAPLAPIQPIQQLPTPQVTAPIAQPVVDDNPLVAADDEVIEKEWVQKAKKIVQDTRNDPHTQEKEVNKLQADYIKKRYGKEIKINNNE